MFDVKCTLISRASVPTGFMSIAGNKSDVGIRFRFYATDIWFSYSHFASGNGKTQRHNDDYQTIESFMAFTDGLGIQQQQLVAMLIIHKRLSFLVNGYY